MMAFKLLVIRYSQNYKLNENQIAIINSHVQYLFNIYINTNGYIYTDSIGVENQVDLLEKGIFHSKVKRYVVWGYIK